MTLYLTNSITKIEEEVLIYLINEPIVTLYTLTQYETEIISCKKGRELLEKYGNELDEPLFMELLRRSGVIYNNDAMYFNSKGETVKQKEKEGFTLDSKAFIFIEKNKDKYFIVKETFLNKEQILEILRSMREKTCTISDFVSGDGRKLIESGEERHLNIIVKYTEKNADGTEHKRTIAICCLTSNKDKGTFYIAKIQHINDTFSKKDKEQRGRVYDQAVRIDDEKKLDTVLHDPKSTPEQKEHYLEKKIKFEQFIHSDDVEGDKVYANILAAVEKKLDPDKGYSVRDPYIFDRNALNLIAQDFYAEREKYLKQVYDEKVMKLDNMFDKKKMRELDNMDNQYMNFIENQDKISYRDQLPENLRELLVIEEKLEEKERIHKKKLSAEIKAKNVEEKKINAKKTS